MKGDDENIKKNKGKQKIEIKKIETKRYCQITFSKRKEGIMKKANEIRVLCNANIDLIIYSSSGKSYYYGDSSLKTMKITLSNEQQSHEVNDQFLSYNMKIDMQNLIEKNDSLVNRLNAEKERAKTLSKILKTIKNDSIVTNWWDSISQSYEKNKEIEEALLVLQIFLRNQISFKIDANQVTIAATTTAENVTSTSYYDDQTMVQVDAGVIEPYPTNANVSIFPNVAFATSFNPFEATSGFDDHNALVQYPSSDQHQQGYNSPFFYNANNWNGAGGSHGGDGGGNHPYTSNYNNNNAGDFIGFPYNNNNGYGGGGFF